MKIDIEKMDLAHVLVALVNAGSTNTLTIQGKLPLLTHRIARQLIDEGIANEDLQFDSVLGRTLNIDLNDDVIDVTDYDRANGAGTALKALQAMGEVKVVASIEVRNAMLHTRGRMEDRLADDRKPDMLMGEAAIRRRFTSEQIAAMKAIDYMPTQADMDAWRAKFNNASPAVQRAMINDDSIKYAYPTKLEDYQLKNPEQVGGFKDSGELHAALRMVGDSLVSVDLVAQNAMIPADSPLPTFEAEHQANKVNLQSDEEGYYHLQLGRLDSVPTVERNK